MLRTKTFMGERRRGTKQHLKKKIQQILNFVF